MIIKKEQRNAIYKKALELYKQDFVTYGEPVTGMCYVLSQAAIELFYLYNTSYENISVHYPEVCAFKPVDALRHWFPLEDYQTRINILEQVIKETEL